MAGKELDIDVIDIESGGYCQREVNYGNSKRTDVFPGDRASRISGGAIVISGPCPNRQVPRSVSMIVVD